MFKKNKNYKLLIGIITGIMLSATGVYAANSILSSDVYYDNSNSSLSFGDVKSAIDELATKITANKPTSCPDGYYCKAYKSTLALGDYVSYTPSSTSYITDTSKTNYTDTQEINPSELNLWRVLNINDDGTVDLISEYVSSVSIYFKGLVGYQNFVGYLNVLASQYETEGITAGSRYFGYNGQTEYITDTSKFVNPAPWTASTSDNSNESVGGGDTLYTTDYNQVNTVLGTRVAYKVGTGTATSYWMASRYYSYSSETYYYWNVRTMNASGSINNNLSLYYHGSSFLENGSDYTLRPIVTLKSGLEYYGLGTEYAPMEIITS